MLGKFSVILLIYGAAEYFQIVVYAWIAIDIIEFCYSGGYMKKVYITKTAHFLPNRPVSNEEMEKYLGEIGHHHSRAKRIVLRNNRITNRHYAIDDEGHFTHTNAELVLESINQLFDDNFRPEKLEMLAAGTSTPDTLIPSHALQVHSMLDRVGSIPVFSSAGVCCSSMHALEISYLALLQGRVANAITAGSELVSPLLRSDIFEIEQAKLQELNHNGFIAFEKDFLRFMLSDGSGAFLLQDEPGVSGISLEIEWIESMSYANLLPSCMYQGCIKDEEGKLKSWKIMNSQQWVDDSVFSIKQDTRILENIIPKSMDFFKRCMDKHKITSKEINYFLPHISSMYFYDKLLHGLNSIGFDLSEENFYTCLSEIGNIGSASIYATLDKLIKERKLNSGDTVVLGVPESAQFQYSMAYLRVC